MREPKCTWRCYCMYQSRRNVKTHVHVEVRVTATLPFGVIVRVNVTSISFKARVGVAAWVDVKARVGVKVHVGIAACCGHCVLA